MFLFIYSIVFPILFLLYFPFYLVHIIKRGGLTIDFLERFAIFTRAKRRRLKALDRPVWIHAVSVGETVAAMTFIKKWRERHPNQPMVFSCGTSTGFATALKKLPADVVPIYCPIDCFFAVMRTMHAVRPSMLCIFEVEIWPNLIAGARRNGAKVVLVNGRMSDKSSSGYAKWKCVFAPLFRMFDAICVQTPADRQRIEKVIGPDPRIHVCDTMKFDQVPDVDAKDKSSVLDECFGEGDKIVFTAGSTHPGEEELVCAAYKELKASHPELFMVLVPRHCERADEAAAVVRAHGLTCKFSKPADGAEPEKGRADVLIVNTTGELMNFFGASDIAYVGKSMAGQTGGHNIIEPAIFGKAVIHGAHMENFRQVAEIFQADHATLMVEKDEEFTPALRKLVEDSALREDIGRRARAIVDKYRGAIDRTLDIIDDVAAEPPPSASTNLALGMVCLLTGIALFSTIEIGQKFIVQQCGERIDPYMMVFVRVIVTGVLLLAIGYPAFRRSGNKLNLKDMGVFLLNGLMGITACLSIFHYAIDKFSNASSAAVVFSANAVFVVIFARFINHEAWTLGKWLAMLLGLVGISMFIFEKGVPNADTYKGIALMSSSAMLFALSVCYTRRCISRYGAMVYMGGTSIAGGLLALPVFFLLSDKTFMQAIEPMTRAPWSMAYYVIVATAFAYYMYYMGIAMTSAFHASMAFMLKPVLACIFAQLAVITNLIASESSMNAWTISGMILVVAAMLLTKIKPRTAR